MTVGIQTTLRGLLERHGAVLVPLIQRDYAQGRRDEVDVRKDFVDSLARALLSPAGDPSLPLNLDFIYGSIEGPEPKTFQPLDGQQRLTTLFLLHWYCAWQDESWTDFESVFCRGGSTSRFTYQVRTSSAEFFDGLIRYRPGERPCDISSVAELITDQSWYFRSWRLDPTVQSILVMLDALHSRLVEHAGLFRRLLDLEAPAITFQLLDLENFGLSDDLYIKMNARGKPLTQFETFKARYEQELAAKFPDLRFDLAKQSFSAADYVSRRLDTVWADLFWAMRDTKSDSYDAALMNVIRAVALVSRDPDKASFINDAIALRQSTPTYSEFHAKDWLDERFTYTFVRVLDLWSGDSGRLNTVMNTAAHFDERATFERIAKFGGNLPYTTAVQLAAYSAMIRLSEGNIDAIACERWMRVVGNLSVNTAYNRVEELRRSFASLNALAAHAFDIESFLADPEAVLTGFSEQQVAEEMLKARLLSAEPSWRPLIDRAEGHPYFRGQIEFLLAFAGVATAAQLSAPSSWDLAEHEQYQSLFLHHLLMAEQMFVSNGLKSLSQVRWERALLALGDYLMPFGRNWTFLTDAATDEGSWKRFLRGTSPKKRDLLCQLWASLDPRQPLDSQLDAIISRADVAESWRAALIQHPEMIDYCEDRRVRVEGELIYLLKRTQLNGAHLELSSYAAYLRNLNRADQLDQIKLDYVSTADSLNQPAIDIQCRVDGHILRLMVFHWDKEFCASMGLAGIEVFPTVTAFFSDLGFKPVGSNIRLSVDRDGFDEWLTDLNAALARRADDAASP